ncbi:ATP-binding protein [Streptomyces sp. NBC_01506]|uniref:ATP-binding protein n=1 Tax=Streptomyces sp. NBC_01506 TaxID=2903887 RepID=UPI003869EB08
MDQRGYVPAAQHYPRTAIAVSLARAMAARAYAPFPWVDHDVVKLLVSETATNAVLHADDGGLDLICHAPFNGAIQIELHDRSETRPVRHPHSTWDQNGRGLELLDLLTPGWSVVRTMTGKGLAFALEANPDDGPLHSRSTTQVW